ncbi:MAG TPA: glycosyltransferase family 9 protein [Kiritimatiellia bacterium]|nr:glycosyltransferase family 9 protein [Kiritimatiellia bacterium]HMO99331.1 glycosyltransferase family 9 protein [Kiritimatiellia bacterium]HMP96089.1 glycosyltransferase family 9 protein [Kiritimatiellia bacterium]
MNLERGGRASKRIPAPHRVLVVSVSGIGNTLLATPFLREFKRKFPQAALDLLVWGKSAAAPLEGSGWVDRIWVAPSGFGAWMAMIRTLRRSAYDVVLTVFPSNKAAYHVFAMLTGARYRVGHAYADGWKRGEWLLTHRVPAQEALHDVEQNLALLDVFEDGSAGEPALNRRLFFHVTEEDRSFAASWVQEAGWSGRHLIGIHPGAGAAVTYQHWQGHWKRWPHESFAELLCGWAAREDLAVVLVGGPEEDELKAAVVEAAGSPANVRRLTANLKRTAAVLERCSLMISNDSGLMHVATAMGVPTLALFGPTQPSRTSPVGEGHRVLRKEGPGRPCLRYPFHSASSKIRCPCQGQCLRDISVDDVRAVAGEILAQTGGKGSPKST